MTIKKYGKEALDTMVNRGYGLVFFRFFEAPDNYAFEPARFADHREHIFFFDQDNRGRKFMTSNIPGKGSTFFHFVNLDIGNLLVPF